MSIIGCGRTWPGATRRGDKYVTVTIDLTRLRETGRSPANMRASRWTASPKLKTAIREQSSDASTVMRPFHVVALASDALDGCRHASNTLPAGTATAPATPLRCVMRTGTVLLTERQRAPTAAVPANAHQVEVRDAMNVGVSLFLHPAATMTA